jgi:UDP-N-acetylmuramate--alanine ligase
LGTFQGIHRRLEKVGEVRGVTVIDDYAHNPAKIQAAWKAVAPYSKRVLAAWRPHGFKPLAVMMDELVNVIAGFCRKEDRFYVLPVYDAGGTADRSTRSEMLVEKLKARNVPAEMAGEAEALVATLAAAARPGDAIGCRPYHTRCAFVSNVTDAGSSAFRIAKASGPSRRKRRAFARR